MSACALKKRPDSQEKSPGRHSDGTGVQSKGRLGTNWVFWGLNGFFLSATEAQRWFLVLQVLVIQGRFPVHLLVYEFITSFILDLKCTEFES